MTLRRRLAQTACRALLRMLPPEMQPWAHAVRHEVAQIPGDTAALFFGLDSLRGLAPYVVAPSRSSITGAACAVGAVALGAVYLNVAGAPIHYARVNAAALLIGLALLAFCAGAIRDPRRWAVVVTQITALSLLATAFFGDQVEGAARWLKFGSFALQPSLVLLPMTIVGFVIIRDWRATTGMLVIAAALALQPDRAMAGMLAASLAVLLALRRDRHVMAAFAGSVFAFGVTLLRPETLPPAPYVTGVLYVWSEVNAFAGLTVVSGSVLLLIPAITGMASSRGRRTVSAVHGASWLAAILAAALGNSPTPLVGYGASAVIGYVLSLAMLPPGGTPEAMRTS
ncbi:MAG: FtsW/RodA/SpoVE family cell cycle protein [Bryobacteraceae bacterium]|nr:FtsW/RodA/SpoVE family cell cycle protein [Bryobacteraceae bacterium]